MIIGDGAVGKMTVAQELKKITDLKLFHNHMSIEPVLEVFGTYNIAVVKDFRKSVFKNFVKTDNYGLIFTCMWAFDSKEDWKNVRRLTKYFKESETYYIELVASQEIRLQRNVTENRLNNKPSKRDVEASRKRILESDEKYRFVSNEGELKFQNYIKIDNSNLSAQEVAKMIKEKFNL